MLKAWDPLTDIPNLHGKIVVVTGGSSGIGLEIVRRLSLKGAKVYLTTRCEANAQKALDILRTNNPEIIQRVACLVLDLSNLKSVTDAANELKKKESKVDILVNNAGAATSNASLLDNGWEYHMAVNYVGHFVFVNRLLPLLKKAVIERDSDVRVIHLSSTASKSMLPHNFQFRFNCPDCLTKPISSYPGIWRYFGRFIFAFDIVRYAVSKAAITLFAQELQRRLDEQGLPILSISVHPGEVATEGVMASNNVLIRTIARLSFLSPDEGATSPLFAVTAKEIRERPEIYRGKFLLPVGKVEDFGSITKDERQVKGLWMNTTQEVSKYLCANNLPPLDFL